MSSSCASGGSLYKVAAYGFYIASDMNYFKLFFVIELKFLIKVA